MRKIHLWAVIAMVIAGIGCGGSGSSNSNGGFGGGGGGGTPTGNNVQPISVNLGPLNDYANGVFTSVTICAPGTSNCQTINDVLVDTGSYGLRVLATSNDPQGGLSLSLPAVSTAGNPLGECIKFADGSFTWGPVRTADVKMGGTNNAGETASSIPINVIGDASFAAAPTSCSTGGKSANTLQALGAHGILGVGIFPQDCGLPCTAQSNGPYYACPASGCSTITVSSAQQLVTNPVAAFTTDNNGVIIELPAISDTGVPSASGSMVFGIGTQSNNGLAAGLHFFGLNGFGSFRTNYKGVNYGPFTGSGSSDSYIDSGSNGIFFPDSIATCGSGSSFYCPSSTLSLSATQFSADLSSSNAVSFKIANANTLFAGNNNTNAAFDDLGGTNTNVFDWGLPFFFGKNVYNGIAGTSTPASVPTPYWAY